MDYLRASNLLQAEADKFEHRLQIVREVLRDHDMNPEITIHDSIKAFYERTGFVAEFLPSDGRVYHESSHLAACATTGTAADEGRTAFAEAVFCNGYYLYLDPYAPERHAPEMVDKDYIYPDAKTVDTFADNRIENAKEFINTKCIPCITTYLDNGRGYHTPEDQAKKDRYQRQLEDCTISPEERAQLYARIERQHQFFLRMTGDRPFSAFAAASFAKLPTAILGVIQTDEKDPEIEAFKPIPLEVMESIENEVSLRLEAA